MNKKELEENLIALVVHPRNYTLNGPPYWDSSMVLEPLHNKNKSIEKWTVFNFERGKRYDEQLFDNENEACVYMYEKLKKFQELIGKFNLKE